MSPLLLNYTSNNPNGSGSATPYVDNDNSANNSVVRITNANAKALGLLAANNAAVDASMTFNSAGGFTWDFDPSNLISPGQYDFVGIATHEIGHALGFISSADAVDINSPPNGGPYSENVQYGDGTRAFAATTLDLFRHSTGNNGIVDITASAGAKYFSLDGGVTVGPGMSTGTVHGDGRQSSHFKDGLLLGIMDPTAGAGELLAISNNDKMAFDAIGWNLKSTAAPDGASNFLLLMMGLGAIAALRKRIKS